MQPCNKKIAHLKKSSVAVLTALYVGATGYAAAEPGFNKVSDKGFYQPTFTAEDIANYQQEKQIEDHPSLLKGSAQRLNQHYQSQQPEHVFQPQDGVTGIQTYIVQMHDEPVASYQGDIQGFSATAITESRSLMVKERIDTASQSVRAYQGFLKQRQTAVLSKARAIGANIAIKKQFTLANNAVVVEMTQADAELLATQSGVKRITPNRIFELRTDRGPEFIGADQLWQGATPASSVGVKGEGMVVGIIDTGINTDHPAFASDEQYSEKNPLGAGNFVGDCEEEPELCNDKLIGVRSYPEITAMNADYQFARADRRPENGEDYNGHGSHTASTTAGNYIENTPLQAATGEKVSDGENLPFTFESTSGVAPRAHIISYQVCYAGNSGDLYSGCPESAILSAFEDAIEDGVDAINFSIGGGESFPWEDPVEMAFLSAREAGISVAAAAGNSGPYYMSADHTSPWVTTVGASTHDRVMDLGAKTINNFQGTRTPYTGEYSGKSFSGGITGEVVLAEKYDDPNENDDYDAASCNAPFPAGTFTSDQIVVCLRGDIARVDKAKNVAAGGAGGFILQNISSAENIVADNYVIPGIHLPANARWTIRNWINANPDGAAIATIGEPENHYSFDEEAGNELAIFSSMGPSYYINNLVPDVTAPGVDIYAANADDQPFTANPRASDWTFMSGTSMATPHVTGAMTLLMQMHPDWTPAEIQSALMMTANKVRISNGVTLIDPYYNFMAGGGAIDVAQAANAGLIMDETIENYHDANPRNGGLVEWLNLPSLVNQDCELECTWMRTVKATKDGTWDATAYGWAVEGEEESFGVEVSVTPSNFTLQAGETQDVMVTMKLPNIIESKLDPVEEGAPWDNILNKDAWFNGKVLFKNTDGDSPDAHFTLVAKNVIDELPTMVDIDMARASASESIVVNTDSYSEFTPTYYGLVKPTEITANILGVAPYVTKDRVEKAWDIQAFEVPEGTKRLMVKVASTEQTTDLADLVEPRWQMKKAHLVVGYDANESGSFMVSDEEIAEDSTALIKALNEEMICYSSSSVEDNYCNIIDPKPGKYWFATAALAGLRDVGYQTVTHYAIVKEQNTGEFSVSAPQQHSGNGNYEIAVNWDLPDAQPNDVYYGGFALGNAEGAEGTLGFTSVNLKRDAEALTLNVDQDTARAMDLVNVNVKLKANYESKARDYSLSLTIPDGMQVWPETLTSNNEEVEASLVVEGNTLTIQGTQDATRNVKRDYVVTNNITNEMCKTPMIDEFSTGGYIDLWGDFRIQPEAAWYEGGSNVYFDVPIDWLFYKEGAKFEIYNQVNNNEVRLHPTGAMQFTPIWWMMSAHRGPGFLVEALAPFWRGSFEIENLRNPTDPTGLTIASQYKEERPDLGDLVFLEFDNVTDKYTGDTFDYEVILRSGIDDHEGMFEAIFAYDNLGAGVDEGTIFIEGGDSVYSTTAGFKDGALSNVVGYDDLGKILQDDLVICFDYVGPEQSEVEFNFTATVMPDAKGSVQDITLDYQLGSQEGGMLMHSIGVQSNLKMSDIADMTVAENGRIDGVDVMVVDADQSPNELVVTGENVTAEVDGMSFNLIPDAHFYGETMVTVTVQDKANPADKVSKEFLLMVESDGVELGCTDAAATNYDATANEDDGSCEFASQVTPETEAETKSSSSGSLGHFIVLLLPLLALRRRK
ncbi:peptidase S8 [Pseudoalteromonas sp. XI10]|uniref:S8 family serine peptidase n=1 Tax=Pseudoalteromonas sp. XI10 TaxID=1766621 RepID=UPI0007333AE4|nr:S8 family serine peptidase [Pseudoalteromonas sp. XI10]KTG19042.1 peptidase S8 [Pseudoalteromonas sp. XI10]